MTVTHYTYLSGPNGMRQPVRILDLTDKDEQFRRDLIAQLLSDGELLSAVPFGCVVHDVSDVIKVLEWLKK